MNTKITKGCKILWKGFGEDATKETIIEDITRTKDIGQKYGNPVKSATHNGINWDFPFICSLENGHWAYSYEVMPITQTGD